MNRYIANGKKWAKRFLQIIKKLGLNFKSFTFNQFHKNIYTQILFVNIIWFVISFLIVTIIYDFSVKHITYEQIEQELMQKSTRVNYALLQQKSIQQIVNSKNNEDESIKKQYEQIKFLSEIFDVKITIFDKSGNIISTSAQQEVIPGTIVDKRFTEAILSGKTITTRINNTETKELTFLAAVPMGDSKDTIVNGILLEYIPTKINNSIASSRLFLIIGEVMLLIITIFVSVSQAMNISKPISRLSTYMGELNNGNYVKMENNIITDEIRTLNTQFNKLSDKMQSLEYEIKNTEDERTKLFADISHELRTPLTTIQGFTEAIQDGVIKDKDLMDKYIQIIYSQTIHINRLIDDMLQLSRLESGNIKLEKAPLDLTAIVDYVVEYMKNIAKSNNTNIVFENNYEQNIIMGDIDRIEQIIKNLLQNAINATENGNIEVKIKNLKDNIILSIKDDGVGISKEDLPHIWDRFYQSNIQKSNTRKKQGSGLGLAIVKHLVKLHDGKIEVESKIGIGTTFYVCFPSASQKHGYDS